MRQSPFEVGLRERPLLGSDRDRGFTRRLRGDVIFANLTLITHGDPPYVKLIGTGYRPEHRLVASFVDVTEVPW